MSLLSSFFGTKKDNVPAPTTALDLVTYTARLASNQAQIDPLLDRIRGITVMLKPGQQPSMEEQKAFLDVYLQLEQYLITKEPLRVFTREELRTKMNPLLRKQLEQYELSKKGASRQ